MLSYRYNSQDRDSADLSRDAKPQGEDDSLGNDNAMVHHTLEEVHVDDHEKSEILTLVDYNSLPPPLENNWPKSSLILWTNEERVIRGPRARRSCITATVKSGHVAQSSFAAMKARTRRRQSK